jgi:UDP-glucose 4-epimerase
MKVLITGGAGYIGTELAYELANDEAVTEIIIYDNLSRGNYNLFIGKTKFPNKKMRFVRGELLDTRKLKKELVGVDVVYHLAAKVSTPFADQNPHEFEQTNHWGTAELVYAVEESDVKQFIYTSSASIYGASSEEVDVDSPINPRTFYGISKMRGEEHISRLFSKIETYILRCGNVYGYSKSMRFDSVINKFLFDANCSGRLTINGNGNQHRSFIHIDKTVNVLGKLIHAPIKSGRYDLVEDTLQINHIVDTLKEIYPELEMIYVNQHLKLRELRVKPNPVVNGLIDIDVRTLKEVLTSFSEEFSF